MSKVYSLLFLLLIIGVSARAQRLKPAAASLSLADTVYFDCDDARE